MRLLMCKPNFYNVIYEINPWMNKQITVNLQKAFKQ